MRIKHDKDEIVSKRLEESNKENISDGGDRSTQKLKISEMAKKPINKKSTKVLKREIDSLFSKYIRLRDTDENGNGNCCTCKKHLSLFTDILKDDGSYLVNINAQCGHFISRSKRNTRWNQDNAALQCGMPCNDKRKGGGEPYLFSLYINKKFGYDRAKELYELSREDFKESRIFLYDQHAYWSQKVKELLKDKNFEL